MIINNTPQHQAFLSNVGEIGEFRIRNSAKAFGILSSGLYANKIRAIIRELSCNAVDSHIAAGRADTPFDLHLPNSLEPHFSIRDYGTGLSHDQVTQIYTTYFESTKTESNDFIGALGLGSKSPFSYTDNFTVTAIQSGRKGVYSAFINGEGVPSIALMAEEDTGEPDGVEIKFAVDDRWDFDKFRQEARLVYKYFSLRPAISGCAAFEFENPEYETENIVPGVHSLYQKYTSVGESVAVMGNIAYPIQVPNAKENLGELADLLKCSLEIHFDIGELDFQASREGLSYVPQTIEAIKRKLEELGGVLSARLAEEADAIPNLWDRAFFLRSKKDSSLWSSAVIDYVTTVDLPTFVPSSYRNMAEFEFKEAELAEKWNIRIRALSQSYTGKSLSNMRPCNIWADDDSGKRVCHPGWTIPVSEISHFVINDTNTGAGERVRYHYRTDRQPRTVWLLEKANRDKDMDTAGFFDAIHNPPEDRRLLASSLKQKPRRTVSRDVSILNLERRNNGNWSRRDELVWREAGSVDSFDEDRTYYYIPLNGFQVESTRGFTSAKDLHDCLSSCPGLFRDVIYGVRKKDIETIKSRENWVNLEEHIAKKLAETDLHPVLMSWIKDEFGSSGLFSLPNKEICWYLKDENDYKVFVNKFEKVDRYNDSHYNLKYLFSAFSEEIGFDFEKEITDHRNMLSQLEEKYPLLLSLRSTVSAVSVADYINLIDSQKED